MLSRNRGLLMMQKQRHTKAPADHDSHTLRRSRLARQSAWKLGFLSSDRWKLYTRLGCGSDCVKGETFFHRSPTIVSCLLNGMFLVPMMTHALPHSCPLCFTNTQRPQATTCGLVVLCEMLLRDPLVGCGIGTTTETVALLPVFLR